MLSVHRMLMTYAIQALSCSVCSTCLGPSDVSYATGRVYRSIKADMPSILRMHRARCSKCTGSPLEMQVLRSEISCYVL